MKDIASRIAQKWKVYGDNVERSAELFGKLFSYFDGLGEFRYPVNMDELIRYMGIEVMQYEGTRIPKNPNFLEGRLSGGMSFSYWLNGKPHLLYNKNLTKQWKPFCFAHEIYHLLSPKMENSAIPSNKNINPMEERFANEFASLLLMPEGIFERVATLYPLETVIETFNVPLNNIILRICHSLERFAIIHIFSNIVLYSSYIKAPIEMPQEATLEALNLLGHEKHKLMIIDWKQKYIPGKIDKERMIAHINNLKIMKSIKKAADENACSFGIRELGHLAFKDLNDKEYEVPDDILLFVSVTPVITYAPTINQRVKASVLIAIQDNDGELTELSNTNHHCVLPPSSSYRRKIVKSKHPLDIIEEFRSFSLNIVEWTERLAKALIGDPNWKSGLVVNK